LTVLVLLNNNNTAVYSSSTCISQHGSRCSAHRQSMNALIRVISYWNHMPSQHCHEGTAVTMASKLPAPNINIYTPDIPSRAE